MINKLDKYIKLNQQSQNSRIREECNVLNDLLQQCDNEHSDYDFRPGQLILLSGYPGDAGTDLINRFHNKYLEGFPPRSVYGDAPSLNALHFDDCFYIKAGERGIYGSLMYLHDISGLGFEINIDCIPLSSYTRAVTDLLSIDPFRLFSAGCCLMIVPENINSKVIDKLQYEQLLGKTGDPVIIGHITKDRQMKIITQGIVSLLNRTGRDGLLQVLDRES